MDAFGSATARRKDSRSRDLRPGVETARAGEPPRDPLEVQRAQHGVRGRVGAHEDRDVPGRASLPHAPGDVRGDPVRLLRAAREGLVADRRRTVAAALRDQLLDDPGTDLEAVRVVVADEAVGGVEDRAAGPVVPPQDHDLRVPVALPELEDVADGGAAELVDGLVVVAHHGHVAVALGDERDELRLGPVRVLELVHQHVPEPLLDLFPCRGDSRRSRSASETWSPKSTAPFAASSSWYTPYARASSPRLRASSASAAAASGHRRRPPAAAAASRRQPLGVREERLRGHVLVLGPREQRRERVQELGRVAQRPVLVQPQLEHVLAQEHDGLGAREHPHVRRQSELQGELPDEPVPEGVERGDRRVRVAVRDQLVHADLHLVRGLVRERESQDLRRPCPLGGDEPGDPPRDDRRLAGARARDDQQRSVAVHDRLALLGVQPFEQLVRARGRRARLDGRPRSRPRPGSGPAAPAPRGRRGASRGAPGAARRRSRRAVRWRVGKRQA